MNKRKRENEARILEEMERAMRENATQDTEQEKRIGPFKDKTPETWHCHKCGTLMVNGKCPHCGHTVYVPMSDKTTRIIRWIVGGVCLAVVLIVLIATR